jgi:hypothetical protein
MTPKSVLLATIPLIAAFSSLASAAKWTFKGYITNPTCDDSITIPGPIGGSQTTASGCRSNGPVLYQSIYWDSDGSPNTLDSFFLCLYADDNCSDAEYTLAEGNEYGCMSGGFPNKFQSWSVHPSSDAGCYTGL